MTLTPLIYWLVSGFFDEKTGLYYGKYIENGQIGELIGWIIIELKFVSILAAAIWFAVFGGGKWESDAKLPPKEDKLSLDQGYYNLLLQKGQKSIATVVSVQYKPNSREYIESYQLYYKCFGLYIHDCPCFEISYRFNPPDDSLSSDLVHRITIHRSPTGHLEPGDPLPILYYVNPDMPSYVYSMPFPFALSEVEYYSDIICNSNDGRVFSRDPIEKL